MDPETKNKNSGRWILFSPFHKKTYLRIDKLLSKYVFDFGPKLKIKSNIE